MTNAYCTIEDVKQAMAGDSPSMGSGRDQTIADKILEVSRDIDRCITDNRGDPLDKWSFLADHQYSKQIIYISATPPPSGGTFVLSFGGQVTDPIDWDASASDVQSALEALSTVGTGNVIVTGFDGGPYSVNFAGTLVGPQDPITGRATLTPTDASIVVLMAVSGVSEVPSARRFRATPDAYGPHLLMINDCIEIISVSVFDSVGAETVLDPEVDYGLYPSNELPIEALKATVTAWPEWPGYIEVTARWGYAVTVPTDVREATVTEVIRNLMAAQAGNDDRIGVTPFGRVMTSKAYTSKFYVLTQDYGHKLW